MDHGTSLRLYLPILALLQSIQSPAYHLTYPSPAHSHWYASRYLSRRRRRRRPDPHHAVSSVNEQGWTIAASEPNSSCDRDGTVSFSVTLVLDSSSTLISSSIFEAGLLPAWYVWASCA